MVQVVNLSPASQDLIFTSRLPNTAFPQLYPQNVTGLLHSMQHSCRVASSGHQKLAYFLSRSLSTSGAGTVASLLTPERDRKHRRIALPGYCESLNFIMKLLAVALFTHRGTEVDPACLGLAAELSSYGYFQRSTVKDMLLFTSKTIVQRTAVGQRQTVKQEDYYCHVHVKDGGIAGVAVTDKDYPTIAAFSVVGKAIEEFLQLGDESWRTQTADGTQAQAVVESAVTKYQVCAAP